MSDLTKCDWCGTLMAKKEAFDYSIYNRKLDVDEESEDLCAKCMRKLKRFTRTARNARAP